MGRRKMRKTQNKIQGKSNELGVLGLLGKCVYHS
jgi:hypothetical protein